MESMADLTKNRFASVVGKSEVSVFVQSLRKSLGRLTFNRPTIVAFFPGPQRLFEPLFSANTDPVPRRPNRCGASLHEKAAGRRDVDGVGSIRGSQLHHDVFQMRFYGCL